MHIETIRSRKRSLSFSIAAAVLAVTGCSTSDPASATNAVAQPLSEGGGAPASANRHRPRHHHRHNDCPPPDDDPNTPGDDRAGYVQCGDSLSCGPDTGGCCTILFVCADETPSCPSPSPIVNCDGPEDCTEPGQKCWGGMVGALCDDQGPFLKCHTDRDCTEPSRPVCNSTGGCVEM